MTIAIIIALVVVSLFSLFVYFIYPRIERDIQTTEEHLHLLNSGQLQLPEDIRADLEEGIRNSTNMLHSIPTTLGEVGRPMQVG